MKDKRTVVLGPPEPEKPQKTWKRSITTNEDVGNVESVMENLEDWFKYSQNLQVQITSLMVSMQTLQKSESANPKSFQTLSDRLRPLVAMKENIDVYICQLCEETLDLMDEGWPEDEDE